MQKNVLVLIKDDQVEVWGALTDICQAHPELSYEYIKGWKFPFAYKGFIFKKISYKQKTIV